MIYIKSLRWFMTLDRQHVWLTTFSFFSENRTVLEMKHHVCDLESTETVRCSNKGATGISQNISWYNGSTGVKIKSGGRIELNGLSLRINNIQLDDARTYECRGVFSTRFYTIYVNSEFSLCPCSLSLWHYFCYTSPLIQCNVFCIGNHMISSAIWNK